MSWGLVAGKVREGCKSTPRAENFQKQGLKQGLLVHSEQIVKDRWRWTLDFSFKYRSVIWELIDSLLHICSLMKQAENHRNGTLMDS